MNMTLLALLAGALVLIVAASVIAFLLVRHAKAPAPKPETLPATVSALASALVSRELAQSFREVMERLRTRFGGADFRYESPWYLVLGPAGSGKSALLNESSLAALTPDTIPVEQGQTLTWTLFDDAVILEVGAAHAFAPAGAAPFWNKLLGLLSDHRPARPLDGIVLTLAATDLIGPTALPAAALVERATLLQDALQRIQGQSSLHLPVYFIVTHCDALDGFMPFVQALAPAELDEVFGWSNPFAESLAFQPEWASLALHAVAAAVQQRTARIFASSRHARSHDAMFLLGEHLQELQPNLGLLLNRILHGGRDVPAPMFRGLFFTGAGTLLPASPSLLKLPEAMPVAPRRMSLSPLGLNLSELAAPPNQLSFAPVDRPRIAFIHKLLLHTIVSERDLAVPLAGFFLARNRTRRFLQIASAGLALVLSFGMTLAYFPLAQTRQRLLPKLTHIANRASASRAAQDALDRAPSASPQDSLAAEMIDCDRGGMSSAFYPASWAWLWPHALDNDLRRDMLPAFQTLVLERLEQRLESRAGEVTGTIPPPAPALVSANADSASASGLYRLPAYLQLQQYTAALSELQQNIQLYSLLRTPGSGAGLRTVIQLNAYLNHQPIPPMPEDESLQPFADVVSRVEWKSFVPAQTDMQRAYDNFLLLVSRFFKSAIEQNPLRIDADKAASTLNALSVSSPSYADLAGAQDRLHRLSADLTQPDLAWARDSQFSMPLTIRPAALSPLGTSEYLLPSLAPEVMQLADASFTQMKTDLTAIQTPLTGVLLSSNSTELRLSDDATEMENGLDKLLNLSFVTPRATGSTLQPAAGDIVWDKPSLDLAATLPQTLHTYLTGDLGQAPTAVRLLLGSIARQRMGLALETMIAGAALPGSRLPANPQLDGDLMPAVQRFAAAAPSLRTLLDSMQANGLGNEQTRLNAITTRQASYLLDGIDRAFNNDLPFSVPAAAIKSWNGTENPALRIYEGSNADELAGYFTLQTERVRAYVAAAAPLLQFLEGSGANGLRSVRRWEAISVALRQFDAKRPGNSIATLEQYIGTTLPALSIERPCRLARSGTGDYFQQTLSRLQSSLYVRCETLRGSGESAAYAQLAGTFNTTLAGHFPFAGLQSSVTTEADPQEIGQFLKALDASSGLLHGSAFNLPAQSFLATLAEDRLFLSQFANPVPTLDFIPHFRANRTLDVGGDQISEWTLQIGNLDTGLQTYSSREPERRATWTVGQPIVLTLRWARNAAFVPTTRAAGAERAQADSVTYRFDDPWSLLRFAQTYGPHRSGQAESFDPADRDLLAFRIPETGVHPLASLQPVTMGEARVFLRLELLVHGKPDAIPFPRLPLPTAAPAASAPTAASRGTQP